MKVQAILFDTRSIQRYIFSGNKLKTNIGASYIVEHLFEEVLVGTVLQQGNFGLERVDADSWQQGGSPEQGLQDADCYVAYIGGGNALVLFKEKTAAECREIVAAFTKKVLVMYPGLRTGSAIGEVDLSAENFSKSQSELYALLKNNQNIVFPQVNVPYTGLTLACEVNGEAANFYDTRGLIDRSGAEYRFYSQEVRSKAAKADEANRALHEKFQGSIGSYSFPMELERLGQREGENDIAIVHIDGNQMGKRFSQCATLKERSALSKRVKEKTEKAFAMLLESIIAEYEIYDEYLDLQKNILPVRPLILGGDDVTFVCPARVALIYAKRFMEYMDTPDAATANLTIKSCAGIAILTAAYPFFRGYRLAEQLCDSAKEKSRAKESSWLDFAILHGEQAPELEQIRHNEYTAAQGNMHFGPYRVDEDNERDKNDKFALAKLLACTRAFNALPGGKVKELRSVIQRGEHEIRRYLEQLKHMEMLLPDIPGWEDYQKNLWYGVPGAKKQTPYVDAIEMMDYIYEEKGE